MYFDAALFLAGNAEMVASNSLRLRFVSVNSGITPQP